MRPALFLAVLLTAITAVPSFAQETTGHLEGRVLDPEGKPVGFVQVIVKGPDLQGPRSVMSLPDGYFYVLALPVGPYTVQLVHVSYQQSVIENAIVRLGAYTDLGDIRLVEQVYETREIVVTGKAPLIDPASTAYGANLVAKEYGDLPIDRNYRDMTTLLPHINESFLGDEINYAGGTGRENKYYIDGADATEIVSGGESTELPYNFVREVRVRSGGYQAEYRGALGGVVDVVTHSGGNEVSGQVFGFFLNDQLAGEPRLSLSDPNTGSFSMYDVGGCVGGPIKQDKLWYFLSYNPAYSREEVDVPALGLFDQEGTSHRFAGKLSWRLDENNDVDLSVLGDPTRVDGVESHSWLNPPVSLENPDPMLVDIESGGVSVLLNGRHWLHERFLLRTTASAVTNETSSLPATDRGRNEPLFIDTEDQSWSGGSPYRLEARSWRAAIGVNGTLIWGNHTIKSGVEYRHVETDFKDRADLIMRYLDPEVAPDAWFLWHFTFTDDGTVGNRLPSAFLQDSWRLRDRLRLNYGIRWDGQYIINSEGGIGQRFLDQWQPRLGFTYQVGERGKHQVFGSYGRFYQDLSMAAPSLYFLGPGYAERHVTYPENGEGDSIVVDIVGTTREETEGLEGQHYDEFTLGYEQQLTLHSKVSVRGVYRTLRNGLEDAILPEVFEYVWGNPGSGELSEFPKMKREYTALEVTFQRSGSERVNLLASYLLSRNTGNYTGIFASDFGGGFSNAGPQYDSIESMFDSDGLLPNDRPHVLKLSGSYKAAYGLTLGLTAFWMSGTPLNEFGAAMQGSPADIVFVVPRGEAGRTPSIWDLNVRLTYDLAAMWSSPAHPRLILDFLHLASQREPVNLVQQRYLARDEDGNHIMPNPLYGLPTAYQPPAAVRLGLEVDF